MNDLNALKKNTATDRMLEAVVKATPLPPMPEFARVEQKEMLVQITAVTNAAVSTVREVMKVAEQLERLVIENASSVMAQINSHVELADEVKQAAEHLGKIIGAMRDAQAGIAKANRTSVV